MEGPEVLVEEIEAREVEDEDDKGNKYWRHVHIYRIVKMANTKFDYKYVEELEKLGKKGIVIWFGKEEYEGLATKCYCMDEKGCLFDSDLESINSKRLASQQHKDRAIKEVAKDKKLQKNQTTARSNNCRKRKRPARNSILKSQHQSSQTNCMQRRRIRVIDEDHWIQCCFCKKWRVVEKTIADMYKNSPKDWYCWMGFLTRTNFDILQAVVSKPGDSYTNFGDVGEQACTSPLEYDKYHQQTIKYFHGEKPAQQRPKYLYNLHQKIDARRKGNGVSTRKVNIVFLKMRCVV